jgi:putative endonuclease
VEDHQADRIGLGRSGEEIAVRYLQHRRWIVLERGFRMLRGEIDIIARDKGTLVFLEVKTRRGLGFGPPAAAVTPFKQRQIRRIAQAYLSRKGLAGAYCRFDVIALVVDGEGSVRLEHVKDAF